MILLLHITIALASIVSSTVVFFRPSRSQLHISYGLILATLASGTYLAINSHANLVSACMSGLIYIGLVSVAIVAARHKLAKLFLNNKDTDN